MPTSLDQTWSILGQGYIWQVGNPTSDDEIWEPIFSGAMSVDPKEAKYYAMYWFEVGVYGGKDGLEGPQYKEIECFFRAVTLDPKHAKAWVQLGLFGGHTVHGEYY